MKRSKLFSFVLVFVLVVAVAAAGCIGGEKTTTQTTTPQQTTTQTTSELPEIEIVFANAEGPGYEVDLQYWVAEYIENKSNGKIKFKHVIGGALGGDKEVTEMLQAGTLQCSRTGGYPSSVYLAKWMPLNIPFLLKSWGDAREYLEEYRPYMNEELKQYNLIVLAWTRRGPRQVTSNKPIYGPEDFKGLKIRLPEFPVWIKVWESLGVLPTPMAFTEVYSALEKGVIDAQENPVATIYAAKFYEVQDYLILTEHQHWISDWTCNLEWFESLPKEYQDLFIEAFRELEKRSDELAPVYDEKLLNEMKPKFKEVIVPDKEAIFEAARPAATSVAKEVLAPEAIEWLKKKGYITD